jgi:hypothetical protein
MSILSKCFLLIPVCFLISFSQEKELAPLPIGKYNVNYNSGNVGVIYVKEKQLVEYTVNNTLKGRYDLVNLPDHNFTIKITSANTPITKRYLGKTISGKWYANDKDKLERVTLTIPNEDLVTIKIK